MDKIETISGNVRKSVTVRKIENGYLICRYKSWEDKEGKYHSEDKEFFSKTNPLEDVEIPLSESFDMED